MLSGGGVKGVALAGAVAALTDAGHEPKRVSGTSAGGVIGAMVAAGLRGAELGEVARAVKNSKFLDPALLDWVPLLVSNDGIYAGKFALQWLTDMLAVHHVHTFADIRDDDPELLPETAVQAGGHLRRPHPRATCPAALGLPPLRPRPR